MFTASNETNNNNLDVETICFPTFVKFLAGLTCIGELLNAHLHHVASVVWQEQLITPALSLIPIPLDRNGAVFKRYSIHARARSQRASLPKKMVMQLND